MRSYTGAERAVDGQYTDLRYDEGQCAASVWFQITAEWRVDLGGVKYIHHVFIQHVMGNSVWGIVSFKLIHSILFNQMYFIHYSCYKHIGYV